MKPVEVIKHKRPHRSRVYGHVYRFADGRSIYIGHRRIKHAWRGKNDDIIAAERAGACGWTFDEDTIKFATRLHNCCVMGVRVKETGDIFAIPTWKVIDPQKRFAEETRDNGDGSGWRLINWRHFHRRPGKIKL